MAQGTGERRDPPELPTAVPARQPPIQRGTRKVIGYFDEWGRWCYGYRDPGNWLMPGEGYDYRP